MLDIKKEIKKVYKKMMSFSPLKNIILFESYPVFSDNTRIIYEELIKQDIAGKYQYIWIDLKRDYCLPKIKHSNTKIIQVNLDNFIDKIIFNHYLYQAKMIISGNVVFDKAKDEQYHYYVSHGTALKDVSHYYRLPSGVDACLSISPFFAKYDAYNLGVDPSKVTSYGFPRTDCFFDNQHIDLKKLFYNCAFKKTILWMPTFRKHINGEINGSDISFPIIHERETAERINAYAVKERILFLVLPHFSQEWNYDFLEGLSNIRMIDNNFLLQKDIPLYRIIKETDALLTDYSSVAIDYLLLDRPIGFCHEDIDNYRKNIGFMDYADELFSCGAIVNNETELYSYVDALINRNDIFSLKRAAIRKKFFTEANGDAGKRVADHIMRVLNNE